MVPREARAFDGSAGSLVRVESRVSRPQIAGGVRPRALPPSRGFDVRCARPKAVRFVQRPFRQDADHRPGGRDQCPGAAVQALSDEELRAKTAGVPRAAGQGRDARRPAARGLRHGARGGQAHARPAPFRRAADRRHGAAPGQDRRDEDRRRQDPGRHPAGLSQRAGRQGRPRRHRQRLPGPARRRVDGPDLPLPRPDASAASSTAWTTTSAGRPMPATSPTAPTTSSASTICATT